MTTFNPQRFRLADCPFQAGDRVRGSFWTHWTIIDRDGAAFLLSSTGWRSGYYMSHDNGRILGNGLTLICPAAEAAERLHRLGAEYPLGARVRHTRTPDLTGTVTAAEGGQGGYEPEPSAWAVLGGGDADIHEGVHIQWDDGLSDGVGDSADWYRTHGIERLEPALA